MDYWKQRRAYRSLKMIQLNISAGQNNLYRELLDYANDSYQLDDWFTMKNEALASLTGLSDRGMKDARNALVQSGLVEYKPGKRSTVNPSYKIICLYSGAQSGEDNAPQSASRSTSTVPHGVPQVVPHGVPPSTLLKPTKTLDTKPSRAKSEKRTYTPESDEMKSASRLWSKIQTNNQETKAPNLQHWADDLRLMHERDGRSWEKINRMIDWSQADAFWSGVILSAKKLREKYDQMAAKANAEAREAAQPKTYVKPARVEAKPDWLDKAYHPSEQPEDQTKAEEIAAKLAKLKEMRQKNADT